MPKASLSVLIKKCGLQFGGLNRFLPSDVEVGVFAPNGHMIKAGWHAWSRGGLLHTNGHKTPENAVSKLLTLIQKS